MLFQATINSIRMIKWQKLFSILQELNKILRQYCSQNAHVYHQKTAKSTQSI